MKNDFPNIELIENFLDGKLNPSDTQQFQNRLLTDIALKEEYTDYVDIMEAINAGQKNPVIDTIQEVHQSLVQQGFFLEEDDIMEYLAGNLSEKDTTIIEQRIEKDEDFRQLVAEQKDIFQALKQVKETADLADFFSATKDKLAAEGFFEASTEEMPVKTEAQIKPIRPRRQFLSYAAGFLLLIMAGLGYYFSQPKDYQPLVAQSFSVEAAPLKTLLDEVGKTGIGSDNEKILFGRALNAFLKGNTAESIKLIKTYLSENPSDWSAHYYLGKFQLAGKEYRAAQQTFEPILTEDTPYQSRIKWYLGLAYLATPDTLEKAKKLFAEIAQTNNAPYQKEAKDILNQL